MSPRSETARPPSELEAEAGDTDELTVTVSSPGIGAAVALDPAGAVLEEEQRARSVRGLAMMAGISLFGALGLGMVSTPGPSLTMLRLGLLALAIVALVQLVRVRRGHAYDRSYVVVSAALVDLAAAAYVGFFSLVTIPLPILVLFAGQDKRRTTAWAVYLTSAIGVAALAALAFAGLLDLTSSVLALAAHPGRRLLSLTVFLELILGVAFAMAINLRKSTEQAMKDLARAHGEIRQRDVLLSEVRADVERWNAAGRGGRFTGQQLGPFRVGEIVGRGGMGDVYAAEHAEIGTVALKVLHEHLRGETDALQRFFREARVTSNLDSPHIAGVFMTGTTDRGTPYLAMERLRGRDLGTILRQRGSLSLAETVALVRDVSRALSAAHRAGVVHRDIKPQNLFRCDAAGGTPVWKVLDFGISKVKEIASTLTEGKILGTPGYMAPEQARGDAVDERADICSLAMVTYRALTGRSAFRGRDTATTIYNVLHCTPVQPRGYADVPEEVELVLALALAKNRGDRFDTVDEFAGAFEAAAASRLDPPLRARARERLAVSPWGSDVTDLQSSGRGEGPPPSES